MVAGLEGAGNVGVDALAKVGVGLRVVELAWPLATTPGGEARRALVRVVARAVAGDAEFRESLADALEAKVAKSCMP